MGNLAGILKKLKVTLCHFQGGLKKRPNVFRVENKKKEKYILKTDRFESFQKEAFLALNNKSAYYFTVPEVIASGHDYLLTKEIKGRFLSEYFNDDIDKAVEISAKLCRSYGFFAKRFAQKNKLDYLKREGQRWTIGNLYKWSGELIKNGYIKESLIKNLEFELKSYFKKDFFYWCHGDIIGENVIIDKDNVYLLDLSVRSRPGNGYHDFIRAIDFLFLKSSKTDYIYKNLIKWLRIFVGENRLNEAKLLLTFKSIGVFGWDLLVHKDPGYFPSRGDLEKKKKILLKIINREY